MNPKTDGVNHINIYSAGKTELGKFLSNFAYSPITTDDGHFDSVEGYWYWLSNRQEMMRATHGYSAKKAGKAYPKVVQLTEEEFQRKITTACWVKIHSNPHMLDLFRNSTLLFAHYYVFNGVPKDAGYKWVIDMWELFRANVKIDDTTFKVIIAGGRDYNNYQQMITMMDAYLENRHPHVIIISGGAKGADSLGESYAALRGYKLIVMKADWDKYGKRAGYLRNKDMLDVADASVCFWDEVSRGTGHMVRISKESGKPCRVVPY